MRVRRSRSIVHTVNTAPAESASVMLRPFGAWRYLLVALLTLCVGISDSFTPRPLETHEVFVAQTAREMLANHDWVLPTFNAEPRLNKPPLAYWLVMTLESVLPAALKGPVPVPEWMARLPSALAAVVVAVCCVRIARRLYRDNQTALLSGLLVAASSGVFRYANDARPEMLYAASCAIMILGIVESAAAVDHSRRQTLFAAVIWVSAAAGIFAKGPHFPALILLGVVVGAFATRPRIGIEAGIAIRPTRLLAVLRPWWGVPLMLAIALPWVIAVIARASDAGGVWFHQLVDSPDRGERTWAEMFAPYYLWGLPQILLPWAVLLPFAFAGPFSRSAGASLRSGRLLFWIFAAVLVVLSITTHRRSYYMLPMLATLAPLTAAGTLDAISKLSAPWGGRLRAALFAATIATIGTLMFLGTQSWAWGSGGEAKRVFAIQVKQVVGDETAHLLTERPGLITYTLNRTTPSHDSVMEVVAAVPVQAWLVTHPRNLEPLREAFELSEPAAIQSTGEPQEDRVLVRLMRRAGGPKQPD